MALNVNLYYTDWADKSYTDCFRDENGDEFTAPVTWFESNTYGC